MKREMNGKILEGKISNECRKSFFLHLLLFICTTIACRYFSLILTHFISVKREDPMLIDRKRKEKHHQEVFYSIFISDERKFTF